MMLESRNYELVCSDEKFKKNILFESKSHRLFEVSNDVKDMILGNKVSCIEEIQSEWSYLEKVGLLGNFNPESLAKSSPLDGANLALNINLTAFCNLGCSYCFADGGDYGRIKGKLSKDVDVDSIVNFIKENTKTGETVRFEFFGGEPLMNPEVIKELCKRSDNLKSDNGLNFIYRVSTNLTTKLSDDIVSLFKNYKFIVSTSIDGGKETHNKNRPRKSGAGSFETILNNCKLLRGFSEELVMIARMTYVPYEGSSLIDDVDELYNLNIFDWFQIYPANVPEDLQALVFKGEEILNTQRQIRYKQQVDKVNKEFKALYEKYLNLYSPNNRFNGLLETELLVRMIIEGEFANGFCSGGRKYYTFSPDKSIMPCHRLVGREEFQVGEFDKGLGEKGLNEWRKTVDTTPVCSDCSIRYLCGGGCKQENHSVTEDLNKVDLEKCEFLIDQVRNVIRLIGGSNESYKARKRTILSDLFVSCGRPIMKNKRNNIINNLSQLQHFTPIT